MLTKFLSRYRRFVEIVVALVVPFAVAVTLAMFRGTFVNAAAALVLIASVVVLAVFGTRLSGFVASISAALWFDYLLTVPYGRLAISRRPDIETAFALLVVGIMITELAARSRHHRRRSSEEADYVAMFQSLTRAVAETTPRSRVIESTEGLLVQLLGLRACSFEVSAQEFPRARLQPDGNVVHVGLRWPVSEMGIPGPDAEIPCEWRGREFGRFVLTPTPGRQVCVERRVVAVALTRVATTVLIDEGPTR